MQTRVRALDNRAEHARIDGGVLYIDGHFIAAGEQKPARHHAGVEGRLLGPHDWPTCIQRAPGLGDEQVTTRRLETQRGAGAGC
jgi:hypothetical protein